MPQLQTGQRLFNGRYELLRMLGAGGMGVVWLARDRTEELDVALKFLPSVLVLQEGEMKRLREEVRAGKELRHPRLVATYGMEVENGIAAIIMEFVPGQTLKEKLETQERGFFEPAEIASWVKDAGSAIEYLHGEAKRIHRDLKPANIIVDAQGRARLMDFGISRRIEESVTRHSKTGHGQAAASSATLAYASPQQLAGKSAAPADDLYSLGAVLYELLTGTPPFYRGDADLVRGQIKHEPVTPMMERRHELMNEGINADTGQRVPAAVESTVLSCLAKEREARPADAGRVVEGFSSLPSGQEERGGPSASAQAQAQAESAPARAAAAGSGALADFLFETPEPPEPAPPPIADPVESNYGVWLGPAAAPQSPPDDKPAPTKAAPLPEAAVPQADSPLAKIRRGKAATAEERRWGPPPTRQEEEHPQRSPWLRVVTALTVMTLASAAVAGIWTLFAKHRQPQDTSALLHQLANGSVGKTAEVSLPGGVKIQLCFCPHGSFTMGSPAAEAERTNVENQVKVNLTQAFWLARTEFTQAQWRAILGANGSHFKGDNMPADTISWEAAQACIAELNAKVPLKDWVWALPTEAQWEYGCRAGTSTPFSFGAVLNGEEANCDGTVPYGTTSKGPSLQKTAPVGSYAPNAWGLHDMHGNVSEWCADAYSDELLGGTNPTGPDTSSARVHRGGSWGSSASRSRSASRYWAVPEHGNSQVGFRPALVRKAQIYTEDGITVEVRKFEPLTPRTEPTVPKPPPPAVNAMYEVTSNVAGAEVWADKQKIGITPLKFTLTPGVHDLIVRSPDGTPQRFTVRVSNQGVATPSSYRAVFQGGAVQVQSTPPGAECRLSHQQVSHTLTTPATSPSLAAGRWRATFTLPGYIPVEKEVEVAEGVTAGMSVSLNPVSGSPLWNLTKDAPFINSLGMKFVPGVLYKRKDGTVSRKVHFCIWETRSKDFAAFVKATGHNAGEDWRTYETHGWPVGRATGEAVDVSNHPVANVRYEDATAFCKWLTQKERASGSIGPEDEYLLPSDDDWSIVAGLGEREDPTAAPRLKDVKVKGIYPWGQNFPPSERGGNYADASFKSRVGGNEEIENYMDGYPTTAPVGTFEANFLGLYDIGGNLWEWTSTPWEPGSRNHVLRGASWMNASPTMLLSSYRRADENTLHASGFRCTLKVDAPPQPSVPVLEITLRTSATSSLAYDTKTISAQVGQKVRLTFENSTTQALSHNVVIGKLGTRDKMMDIAMSGMTLVDKGFIPESTDILAHTSLVQPGKSETIEFILPAAGEYPYFCTFPGHVAIMNGVITVK